VPELDLDSRDLRKGINKFPSPKAVMLSRKNSVEQEGTEVTERRERAKWPFPWSSSIHQMVIHPVSLQRRKFQFSPPFAPVMN
jgi:hypothetical protein